MNLFWMIISILLYIGLGFGVILLALAATWMQVNDRLEKEGVK